MKMQKAAAALLLIAAVLVTAGAAMAYDVSGSVSYGGPKTGRIYITLTNEYDNSGQAYGVSILSTGSTFTIRGVTDGSYTLNAWLDVMGNRERHPSDPNGSRQVTVTAGNVTGADVTLNNPTPTAPTAPTGFGAMDSNGSNFLMWNTDKDQNSVHKADAFNLYWSTNPSFLASWPSISPDGSITGIKASQSDNGFFHTGLANGTTYYYAIESVVGGMVSSVTLSSGSAAATPNIPVGGHEVSGTLYASGFDPSGATLFALLYSDYGVQYSVISNPTTTQVFSIPNVPDGAFYLYPVYDMNNNGLLDAGDVMPDDYAPTMVVVQGADIGGISATVNGAAGFARVTTNHWKVDNACNEGYGINPRAMDGRKLIANLSLTSAPTNSVGLNGPIDIGPNGWNEFTYYTGTGRPAVGDSFEFAVAYTDGTSETLAAEVTAVRDDFPVASTPKGVIANDPTPLFTWAAPVSAPAYSYTYEFYVYGQNFGSWDLWGLPSTKLQAEYNENGQAYPSTLSGNSSYEWRIGLRDNNGNMAETWTRFGMGGGISGTVTSGGTGVHCAQVQITTADNPTNITEGYTDANGFYAVGGFGAGSYKVRFVGQTFNEYYNSKTEWNGADPVTVFDNTVTGSINANVGGGGGSSAMIGTFRGNGNWFFDEDRSRSWSAGDGSYKFGRTGDIPVVGDWGGDGMPRPGVFRPSTGHWYLDMNGDGIWNAGDVSFKFGQPGDIPVTGDWTGDGTTKVGVFRGNGSWSLDMNNSHSWDAGDITFKFGQTGDIPVTGDWSGDGSAKVGVFRGNGSWSLDMNNSRSWNEGDVTLKFGQTGDIPVTGDWNNDGTTEVGVFRGNGAWFLDVDGSRTWNAGDETFKFGQTGDRPFVVPFPGGGGGGTPPTPPTTTQVSGSVTNLASNSPVAGASVWVVKADGTGQILHSAVSDSSGYYNITVPYNQLFYFHTEKTGYVKMNTRSLYYTSMSYTGGVGIMTMDEPSAIAVINSAGFCIGDTSMSDPCLSSGLWFGINTRLSASGLDAPNVTVSVAPTPDALLYNDGTGVIGSGTSTTARTANPQVPMVLGEGSVSGIASADGNNGVVTRSVSFPLVAGEIAGVEIWGF